MVYCTKCGTKNEEDATICVKCGASLAAAPAGRSERRRQEKEEQECFGSRQEKGEQECFGLPHGGAIAGLVFGTIIIIAGLLFATGMERDRGNRFKPHLAIRNNHLRNTSGCRSHLWLQP